STAAIYTLSLHDALPIFGLLMLVLLKDRQVKSFSKWMAYSVSIGFVVLCAVILYAPSKLLPDLIIDGEGTTTLKNSLQLLALGRSEEHTSELQSRENLVC